MSTQKKIRLLRSNDDEFRIKSEAIHEARGRIEAENAAELAVQVRARAEAQARAIAEGKLFQENKLLELVQSRSQKDLQLVDDVQARLELEQKLLLATNENIKLEAKLAKNITNKIRAELQAKIDFELNMVQTQQAQAEHEKNAILDRDAASIAQDKLRYEEQIAGAIEEKITIDKKAKSLLEGKLIAEIARAEGAQLILQLREETLALLKQGELEEKALMQLETQAKEIALGRIESVRLLKIAAQQRVDQELLASRGIEIQLHAEEEAVVAANNGAEMSAFAKQAADIKWAQEKQYAELSERNYIADQIVIQEFDRKLELINGRIILAEQHAGNLLAGCLAEESKLALDTVAVFAESECLVIEQNAVAALNKRLALQEELSQAAALRLQTDANAIAEISMRNEAELQAVEAGNARIALEQLAKEMLNEQLRLTEEISSVEKTQFELERVVLIADRERIVVEKEAVDQLNIRLQRQQALTEAAALRLKTENTAIAEISMRMEVELKAIEGDNERIELEVGAREILEAQLRVTDEIVSAEKMKEEMKLRALRMAKVRAGTEAKAAQAELDLFNAHTHANKLATQRIVTAQNLKLFVDERVQDELLHLNLELKNCDAKQGERNVSKARMEAEQRLLSEVEKRIFAENQAMLAANQRQIAEQLVRQGALDKWTHDKQTALALNAAPKFALALPKLSEQQAFMN